MRRRSSAWLANLGLQASSPSAILEQARTRTPIAVRSLPESLLRLLFLEMLDRANNPATPPTDRGRFFSKNGTPYYINDAGTVYNLAQAAGAPAGEQYLVLALSGTLTGERRFVPGLGLSATDGGANNDYDLVCLLATGAQVGILSLAAQTLGAGVKTFSSIPVLPASNPTTANQAVRKAYADLMILKSLLTTRGDMIFRNATIPARLAKGTAGQRLSQGADDPAWAWEPAAIEYVIDGGGEVIATGLAGGLEVPFACYIDEWTITATDGLSGAIVVDVWVDTYANFPPTVADTICASMKPTITATSNKGQNTNPTGWSSGKARLWLKGDHVFFNVDSVATLTRVTLSLKVSKNRVS